MLNNKQTQWIFLNVLELTKNWPITFETHQQGVCKATSYKQYLRQIENYNNKDVGYLRG